MLSYPGSLDLSTQTLTALTRLLSRHRAQINSPGRKLTPHRQALCVLVHLRQGHPQRQLAHSFGVSLTTIWRYLHEAITLLAAAAPTRDEALATYARHRRAPLLLDGTLITTRAQPGARHYYSGNHRRYGVNIQVLTDLRGHPIWISPTLPGSTNDLTAARTHGILTAAAHQGLTLLADKGYQGAGHTTCTPHRTPRTKTLTPEQHHTNRTHTRLRAPVERAHATLKTWRILHHLHYPPHHLTPLIQAIHTLHTTP